MFQTPNKRPKHHQTNTKPNKLYSTYTGRPGHTVNDLIISMTMKQGVSRLATLLFIIIVLFFLNSNPETSLSILPPYKCEREKELIQLPSYKRERKKELIQRPLSDIFSWNKMIVR